MDKFIGYFMKHVYNTRQFVRIDCINNYNNFLQV